MARLAEYRYRTVSSISGPLLFLKKVYASRIGEVVRIVSPSGHEMAGEVLKISDDTVMIECYGSTQGLDVAHTEIVFTDAVQTAPLSMDIIGRRFSGSFRPIDGMPAGIPEMWVPVTGFPINPAARARPEEFIETGVSAVDGLNTLVKGQKLPIFSCAGLPAKQLAAQILRNARVLSSDSGERGIDRQGSEFIVIFVAMGISFHEYWFYMNVLEEMRTGFVAIINTADDSVMERLLAPRFALSAAEYLAFEKGKDILVIITDMTNYCDALREISTARKELPGRRGYPGYMYSDLASLYERAGRIHGMKGSVTILPVVTMPEDDITHPIPDLTGYITEGQIVLSRELHQKGLFPPVDVLPSLSRLMQQGIGEGHTRQDHRRIADLLYKHYAMGRDLRRLESIVGRDGMTERDGMMLDFAEAFETAFINQGSARRSIFDTLDTGINLLRRFHISVP